MILTKKDLIDSLGEDEDQVTLKELKLKNKEMGCQGTWATSAKKWEDHNVYTAFNKALMSMYRFKYGGH